MAASKEDIRGWLRAGKAEGATHVVVVCDGFDYDDYPVYVFPGEDVRERAEAYKKKEMQRVMEVYALHLDIEDQLSEYRAFHYESAGPANVSREPGRE